MLLKLKNGRLWLGDGTQVVESNGSVSIIVDGISHDVEGTFEDVAGEFGFKPVKEKVAK